MRRDEAWAKTFLQEMLSGDPAETASWFAANVSPRYVIAHAGGTSSYDQVVKGIEHFRRAVHVRIDDISSFIAKGRLVGFRCYQTHTSREDGRFLQRREMFLAWTFDGDDKLLAMYDLARDNVPQDEPIWHFADHGLDFSEQGQTPTFTAESMAARQAASLNEPVSEADEYAKKYFDPVYVHRHNGELLDWAGLKDRLAHARELPYVTVAPTHWFIQQGSHAAFIIYPSRDEPDGKGKKRSISVQDVYFNPQNGKFLSTSIISTDMAPDAKGWSLLM